jgi:DNA-binding response OmpR family regulator
MKKDFFKSQTILCIEEDKKSIENISLYFSEYCDNLIYEIDGYKSIKKFNEQKIDLIILELDLTILSGIEIIQRIRKTNYWIPIVVITSNLSPEYLLPCVNSNIQGYIQKPLTNEKTIKLFENVIKYKNQTSVDKLLLDENIYYNSINHSIENNGKIYPLNKKERLLIDLLLENKNRIVSYKNIETIIWYYEDKIMTQDALKNVVKSLRKKISKEIIKNISGLGYKIIL